MCKVIECYWFEGGTYTGYMKASPESQIHTSGICLERLLCNTSNLYKITIRFKKHVRITHAARISSVLTLMTTRHELLLPSKFTVDPGTLFDVKFETPW